MPSPIPPAFLPAPNTELLRDMALFVEVARQRSFTAAAAALRLPKSTLSRRITALEREVGVQLLARTTRRIDLTVAGSDYFERASKLVDEAHAAHAQLQDLRDSPRGQLRVSMPVEFGVLWMAPYIAAFAQRYPDITFDLDLSPRRTDGMEEHFDVAIRMGLPSDANLVVRQLAAVGRALYASPAYLAERGTPGHPAELALHECLRITMVRPETTWSLCREGERVTVGIGGRCTMNNISMVRRLCLEGLGIAVLPLPLVQDDLLGGQLVPVLADWNMPPMPAYALLPSRRVPARVRVFLDFLSERLEAQADEIRQGQRQRPSPASEHTRHLSGLR